MLLKRISFLLISVLFYVSVFSQSNQNIFPIAYYKPSGFFDTISQKNFNRDIQQEIARSAKGSSIPRMGYCINIAIDIVRDAQPVSTPSGVIYLLRCTVKDAKGLVPYFDSFYLSEGSSLHIYSIDRSELLGAFTHENSSNIAEFCPGLVIADDIIFEYKPAANSIKDVLRINQMGIAYQMIPKKTNSRDFGDAGSCQVNINCSEGQKYFNQKRSVVRIMVKSNNDFGWCSGALINNTAFDCKPYVLLADHCSLDGNLNYAAASDFNQWVYYFNYEAPGCTNPLNEGALGSSTINGSSKIANSQDKGGEFGSDFLLTKLNSNPPGSYNAFFAGWNRDALVADSGACIHHPEADLKKLSTFRFKPKLSSWGGNVPNSHWEVNWVPTTNGSGVTEGGSSGGSLFNQNGEIVGTLTGGESFCNNPSGSDYYGKFFNHWDKNDVASNKQLKPWLDPINSAALSIIGREACGVGIKSVTNESLTFSVYPNPTTGKFAAVMDEAFRITIFTIDGKMVLESSGEKLYSFELNTKGMYIVIAKTTSAIITQKIIVE